MNINTSNFAYNATIKLNELPRATAQAIFPSVHDVSMNSRDFSSYAECVDSAKQLMEDIVKDVNTQVNREQFTVSTEINPIHTGVSTRSRDWEEGEISRFWIFDKKQEGGTRIHAVGQARIFAVDRPSASAS